MNKAVSVVFALSLIILSAACGDTTNNYYPLETDSQATIFVALNPDTPDHYVAKGHRLLQTLDLHASGPAELYQMSFDLQSSPAIYVDRLWVENEFGEVVFGPNYIWEDLALGGYCQLAEGKNTLYVMGNVTASQRPDEIWNNELHSFKVVLLNAVANVPLTGPSIEGKTLYPRYNGWAKLYHEATPDSPAGTISSGENIDLVTIELKTDRGSLDVGEVSFHYNSGYQGGVSNCKLTDENGETLTAGMQILSENDVFTQFCLFPLAEKTISISTDPQYVTLSCDIDVAVPGQMIFFSTVWYDWLSGPEGYYFENTPYSASSNILTVF